jgi:hypothetical protein
VTVYVGSKALFPESKQRSAPCAAAHARSPRAISTFPSTTFNDAPAVPSAWKLVTMYETRRAGVAYDRALLRRRISCSATSFLNCSPHGSRKSGLEGVARGSLGLLRLLRHEVDANAVEHVRIHKPGEQLFDRGRRGVHESPIGRGGEGLLGDGVALIAERADEVVHQEGVEEITGYHRRTKGDPKAAAANGDDRNRDFVHREASSILVALSMRLVTWMDPPTLSIQSRA